MRLFTFIDNWFTKLYTLWSVRLVALAAAAQGAFLEFPETMKSLLPDNVMHWGTVILLLVSIYARLVKQDIPPKP